ncbi:MAG: tetratricopeptide repeat protein [Burkholderiales bacterium]
MRTVARALSRFPVLVGVGLIAGLASALYLPFLANPLVFDDLGFFSGRAHAYYATHPFGLGLRVPASFSLASVQVVWGHMLEHRIVSLALHLACSLALYKLLYDLLLATRGPDRSREASAYLSAAPWAFMGAAAFAIHPVAVYGAAYLAQRSIVLATLCSLVSVVLFVRGLARRSHADAISAALLYTIAVLSKEHSVLLPAVAVLTVLLFKPERRFAIRHVAIYLLACAPAAVLVALLTKGLIGGAYEPHFGAVAAQIEDVYGRRVEDFPWVLSAITQAGLFFKYLSLWLWPDTRAMSIDLRVDFLAGWAPGWIVLKIAAFLGWGVMGILLLRRRGSAGLAGFGMLYCWILFLVELSVARFQEPFVLYRSYLWAPGLMVLVASGLARVPSRVAIALALLVLPLLFYQAHHRLRTFSSSLALWEDAVSKLPRRAVPGGSRTLYNLGREYLYSDRADQAIAVAERCLAEYPETYDCHMARASIHLHQEQYRQAIPYLARAIFLRPESGTVRHHLGVALENLGCLNEAREQYRLASQLRFRGADHRLSRLDSPGSGLLPPVKLKPRTEACDEPLPAAAAPAAR